MKQNNENLSKIRIIYGMDNGEFYARTSGIKNNIKVSIEENEILRQCIKRVKSRIVNKSIELELTPENESNYRRL